MCVYVCFNFYLKIKVCLTLENKKAAILNDELFIILGWEDTPLCGYNRISDKMRLVFVPLLHVPLCV